MAVLAVAALLGTIGTIVGFTSGDDATSTEQELEATVASLTDERTERLGDVTELQATIDTVTVERDDLALEFVELENAGAAVAAERDELLAGMTDLNSMIVDLTRERNELIVEVAELEADLATEARRATEALAERDALADLFPMTFDAALEGVELVGTYDVDATLVYSNGFAPGAVLPQLDEFVIRETPEGYLEVVIDDVATAGLFRVDGALYAITDSMTAVPPCNGTPRSAGLTATFYAHGLTVADDGSRQVTDLGASITVRAPATAGCPAALAFYGAELTP